MKLGFHKHIKAAGPIFVENFCYGQNLGKLGIFGPKVNTFSLLMLGFSEIIADDRHQWVGKMTSWIFKENAYFTQS